MEPQNPNQNEEQHISENSTATPAPVEETHIPEPTPQPTPMPTPEMPVSAEVPIASSMPAMETMPQPAAAPSAIPPLPTPPTPTASASSMGLLVGVIVIVLLVAGIGGGYYYYMMQSTIPMPAQNTSQSPTTDNAMPVQQMGINPDAMGTASTTENASSSQDNMGDKAPTGR